MTDWEVVMAAIEEVKHRLDELEEFRDVAEKQLQALFKLDSDAWHMELTRRIEKLEGDSA